MKRELRAAMDRIYEGGQLLGVDAFRFGGDPMFVTALRLRFERDEVTFLTVADDDTVTAEFGPVTLEDGGEWIDVSGQAVWSKCLGGHVLWAWCMTNQQGYADAVRIEFEQSAGGERRIVEFVVLASAFRFFEAREF